MRWGCRRVLERHENEIKNERQLCNLHNCGKSWRTTHTKVSFNTHTHTQKHTHTRSLSEQLSAGLSAHKSMLQSAHNYDNRVCLPVATPAAAAAAAARSKQTDALTCRPSHARTPAHQHTPTLKRQAVIESTVESVV